MNLNDQQKLAVAHHLGTCIVTAVPGSGKCIVGDSWIFSDSQLLSPIQDDSVSSVLGLSDEKLSTVEVGTRQVGKFVDSGIKPVVTIITRDGFSITGTKHHPIVVMNRDGQLVWKLLSDIRAGDFAAIWCKKNCDPKASWLDSIVAPPHSVTKDRDCYFYLMGLLLGDGSLSVPKMISFCCQSELKTTFLSLISLLYGERVSEYPDKRCEDLWNLCVYNKVKSQLIEQFGDIEHGSCDKYLTPEMLSGDQVHVAALIRGLFDTDGHAREHACEITLCSKKLIDQLHLLLLHFGVFSYKKTKIVNGNEYYRIQIHGEDYRRFVRNIGFGISYKKESSRRILQKANNPNKSIPHMRSVLRRLRNEIRDFAWWEGHTATVFSEQYSICMNRYLISSSNSRNLTETSALKIVDICNERNFQSETVSYLKGIAENLCFSSVEYTSSVLDGIVLGEKASLPKRHVFDYEVPKSHSFIANGFINHNTRVLTSRAVSLIRDKGVDPRNILCLTFTNKASNEMKERILAELAKDNVDAGSIWISTFHKLCLAILRKHGSLIGLPSNFSIYASKEQEDLMGKIARMNGYENSSKYAVMHLIKAVNDFREDIVDYKQHLKELDPTEIDIVKEYQETLNELNAIDFSGMLYKSWVLLKSNPAVAESLSKRFKFVLVDEMQDTNHVQYDIIKRIAEHGNLFVVGDLQQSIYGWRGAKPENLHRLRKDFDNVSEVTLPRNYRSTSAILKAAQQLIRHNKDAAHVELHSDRGSGADVKITDHKHPEDEADRLAFQIKSLRRIYDYDWKDFAVLYRMNSLSRAPEMALRTNHIPYRIVGGFSFFDRMEIKAALSYLTLLVNPHDTINFNRAITHPKRGLGGESIGRLESLCKSGDSIIDVARNPKDVKLTAKARANLKTFVEMIDKYRDKDCKLAELAEGIIKESGLYEFIKTLPEKTEADKSRLENLEELIAGIAEYENRRSNSSVVDYLQSTQLIATGDEDNNDDVVKLLTIHSAKGLEWPCVNIIGVENGCLPHPKAESERGSAEERRLMYVAMTRAKDHLLISYCHSRRLRRAGRSRFLDEIYG